MNNNKNLYAKLIPVMLCFFAMGFVDLVGIAGFLLVPYLLGSHRNIDE